MKVQNEETSQKNVAIKHQLETQRLKEEALQLTIQSLIRQIDSVSFIPTNSPSTNSTSTNSTSINPTAVLEGQLI